MMMTLLFCELGADLTANDFQHFFQSTESIWNSGFRMTSDCCVVRRQDPYTMCRLIATIGSYAIAELTFTEHACLSAKPLSQTIRRRNTTQRNWTEIMRSKCYFCGFCADVVSNKNILSKYKGKCKLPIVGFRSWSRFFAVSLQVMWVINSAVSCHYFPPGLQLPL